MKALKTFCLIFSLICLTLHSKPSHAGLGVLAGSAAVVSSGLTLAAIGGAGTVVFGAAASGGGDGGIFTAGIIGIFLGMLGIGLLILEGEQALEFVPLEVAKARQIGLTTAEAKAFNSEIDQINALAGYVDAELSKEAEENRTSEKAAEIWKDVRGEISPAAFEGLVKVNSQIWKAQK